LKTISAPPGIEAQSQSAVSLLHRQRRSTLSYANEHRPEALFEDLFFTALARFRDQQGLGSRKHKFRFKNKLLSLDSTGIQALATSANIVQGALSSPSNIQGIKKTRSKCGNASGKKRILYKEDRPGGVVRASEEHAVRVGARGLVRRRRYGDEIDRERPELRKALHQDRRCRRTEAGRAAHIPRLIGAKPCEAAAQQDQIRVRSRRCERRLDVRRFDELVIREGDIEHRRGGKREVRRE
jgi:hypothetical protein